MIAVAVICLTPLILKARIFGLESSNPRDRYLSRHGGASRHIPSRAILLGLVYAYSPHARSTDRRIHCEKWLDRGRSVLCAKLLPDLWSPFFRVREVWSHQLLALFYSSRPKNLAGILRADFGNDLRASCAGRVGRATTGSRGNILRPELFSGPMGSHVVTGGGGVLLHRASTDVAFVDGLESTFTKSISETAHYLLCVVRLGFGLPHDLSVEWRHATEALDSKVRVALSIRCVAVRRLALLSVVVSRRAISSDAQSSTRPAGRGCGVADRHSPLLQHIDQLFREHDRVHLHLRRMWAAVGPRAGVEVASEGCGNKVVVLSLLGRRILILDLSMAPSCSVRGKGHRSINCSIGRPTRRNLDPDLPTWKHCRRSLDGEADRNARVENPGSRFPFEKWKSSSHCLITGNPVVDRSPSPFWPQSTQRRD
jgi:hypothetical protein